jgi:hypothetical protein
MGTLPALRCESLAAYYLSWLTQGQKVGTAVTGLRNRR